MTMTHTATLIVHDVLTGTSKTRQIQVRVMPTRIEDEQGRLYDVKLNPGRQYGPARMMPTSYRRSIDLGSLALIVRTRVRL